MSVSEAFRTFQAVVDADPAAVSEARTRRDSFKKAFNTEPDVVEVIASGSLARKTQKTPINDVDLVIVFDGDDHPTWGSAGDAAGDALDHTRSRVNHLLGATSGTHERLVRLARWRNHAVKCFIDDPDDDSAFTVDAMPALRIGKRLLVPEAVSKKWIECDPESLIAAVAQKQAAYDRFVPAVRMLKWWAKLQEPANGCKIKSLVMEVLALDYLPITDTAQPFAIKNFFIQAAYAIEGGQQVTDPADLCGPIQSDLDYVAFAELLREAAETSTAAVQAQLHNDTSKAIRLWGDVFGEEFPRPPSTGPNPAPAVVPAVPRPVKDTPQG